MSGVNMIHKTSACFRVVSQRHISANIFETKRATGKNGKIELQSVPYSLNLWYTNSWEYATISDPLSQTDLHDFTRTSRLCHFKGQRKK